MKLADNDLGGRLLPLARPDPHGLAALTLVESLIHCLVERDVLSREDAVGIVETASEVHADIADAEGGAPSVNGRAHVLLAAIEQSLRRDLDNVRGPECDGADLILV